MGTRKARRSQASRVPLETFDSRGKTEGFSLLSVLGSYAAACLWIRRKKRPSLGYSGFCKLF